MNRFGETSSSWERGEDPVGLRMKCFSHLHIVLHPSSGVHGHPHIHTYNTWPHTPALFTMYRNGSPHVHHVLVVCVFVCVLPRGGRRVPKVSGIPVPATFSCARVKRIHPPSQARPSMDVHAKLLDTHDVNNKHWTCSTQLDWRRKHQPGAKDPKTYWRFSVRTASTSLSLSVNTF